MPSFANAVSKRFHYGWLIVAVTALTVLVSMGVRSAPGVFLVSMEQETGWARADIAFAVSIGLLILGFAGPLSGALIDRYGPRRLMVIGLVIVSASMALSFYITSQWQLVLLWGVLSGIGTGITGSVLGPTVANRWFVARRSLVVGMFGAAASAGQLVFVPLLMAIVLSLGWRASSVVLALIALLAVIPVLLFMRDEPADVGLPAYGATAVSAAPQSAHPTEDRRQVMARAVRSSEFWLLAGTFFVCGATSNGLIGTHLIAHASDHGIGQGVAAGAVALMGMMNFVGTLTSGWLTDKYDPRKLLCIYYGFRGLSLLFLPFVSSSFGLALFAILFGLDYIATVPPTTALVADNFGRRNVGTVYGWVFCAHQVGAASAAWLGGVARDTMGDYWLAFLVAGAIAVAAGFLSLRIRSTPQPLAAESVAA
jgi:sugar phosphate permease